MHVSQRILRLPVTYERAAAFNYVLIWIRQHQLRELVWDGGKGQVCTEVVFLFWVENLSSSAIGPKSGNFFNVSDCRVKLVSSDVSAKPMLLCRKTMCIAERFIHVATRVFQTATAFDMPLTSLQIPFPVSSINITMVRLV